MKKLILVAIVSLAIAFTSSVAIASDPSQNGSVVFDSMPNFAGGGMGFHQFADEIGASVAFGGSARHVTQIDLMLTGFSGSKYLVRFYEIDSTSGAPLNMIWESPQQTLGFRPNGQILSSVQVPNVLVPDSMAFTVVEDSPRTHAGIYTSFSPSIGTHLEEWYRKSEEVWKAGPFSSATYCATIFAVPEPTAITLGVILLGFVAAGRRSRK
jgi:hypothetical protein